MTTIEQIIKTLRFSAEYDFPVEFTPEQAKEILRVLEMWYNNLIAEEYDDD